MTKQELIDALEFVDDDAEIFVAVPTGNYWGMVAVKSIDGLDEMPAAYSDYLESLKLEDDDNEDAKMVWVLTV